MDEIKTAVAEKLDELNQRPFQKRVGNRRSACLEEEKAYMMPLPACEFEPSVWSTAKVPKDYLVTDGRNRYSVPSNLIGERVDIRTTRNMIEVFYHGSQVALHRRLQNVQRDPVVKTEHMTPEHRSYLRYNSDNFKEWANGIGPETVQVVKYFLNTGKAPEQGYRACANLMKLGERYGKKRLKRRCV